MLTKQVARLHRMNIANRLQIRAVIGINHFRQGLGNYMAKHKYGNTETFDLWKAWEDVSGLPIKDMMASWTEQMG